MQKYNPFDSYLSKVKRFNIPLTEFSFFHKASSAEEVDPKFLGRENISARLFSWLTKEKTNSGSYIVTGFRGMGKSSFVGRVIYEITAKPSMWTYTIGWICFISLWVLTFIALDGGKTLIKLTSRSEHKKLTEISEVINHIYDNPYYIIIPIGVILLVFFRFRIWHEYRKLKFRISAINEVLFHNNSKYCNNGIIEKLKFAFELRKDFRKDWHKLRREIYDTDISRKSYHRIDISVNLGQEVLNERDVLCILTNEFYNKYRNFVLSPIANCLHWFWATLVVFGLAYTLNFYGQEIIFKHGTEPQQKIDLFIICLAFTYVLYLFLCSQIVYSQHRSLRKLKSLKEALDSIIKYESSANADIKINKIRFLDRISFGMLKSKTRSFANIRNIEEELIAILHRINQGMFSPSFIFILDELDKVEGISLYKDDKTKDIPEYTNEKNFPGSGTSRKRKQNVLHLLANMKLFISTAKSKFIFIAGRELYDAYLADLSDREFAVSSVFYGVINVESFCTNVRKEKDVMSNAETFICKQLIPKEYVRRETIRTYLIDRKNGKNFSYIDVNLKMYYRYMMSEFEKAYKHYSPNEVMEDDVCYQEYRACIDKSIVLLYHFAVYLYHISNGSPKKMSLYLEKYIKTTPSRWMFSLKRQLKEKKRILQQKNVNIWCRPRVRNYLSFGYVDQRRIGFIHYIAFPVTQIIINANQFGDKLLVSASFLIDHIYKFHNGGFSARNLEHTPELLEVYKIPEFRDFIDSILAYLTQTHIIPITCGLFQYKFRKQIAEEISLASKFSEEIAALFNFTLDESLSVKEHYDELQKYYRKQLDAEKTSSPHLLVGLHHIMADLYMADEEYTQAAFEYQTSIEIIKSQKDYQNIFSSNPQGMSSSSISYMLLLIRNMLKLGMAFEKRKSYESAYVTYSELIGSLIDFRYIDEHSLDLSYVVNKTDKWPSQEAILYAGGKDKDETDFTDKVRPTIIDKDSLSEISSEYCTKSSDVITDFAHQMTKEKSAIIQRLTMLEDIRLIYQALLAKLFVLEKMELGGITHTSIELIESEYSFLHLATNEKDKFLISTDFFRRLGDIMFYKNGLTGKNLDSFCDGLFYWAYNIKAEILDFCNEHKCYNIKDTLIDVAYKIKNEDISGNTLTLYDELKSAFAKYNETTPKLEEQTLSLFCKGLANRIQKLNVKSFKRCNKHRKEMWQKSCPVPCYACKYYNRSLRLIMENLFNVEDLEKTCNTENISKAVLILRFLIKPGTSVSLRQNVILQFAEVLECMGNVMLSCASENDCVITEQFIKAYLHDIHEMNIRECKNLTEDDFELLKLGNNYYITKIEKSLIYYWEAAVCFKIASDYKKAAGSYKKILRTIQNYLLLDNKDRTDKQRLIGDYLEEIKERVIKQCLISLYSHYNFINIIEIQKLKWVFSLQMYENISLNRLSLFPDVEEVMLIYYDILRNCVFCKIPAKLPYQTRSWHDYTERNHDFQCRLAGIYNNIILGSLRIESTFYERVLSLRFKANMNQHILHHLFAECGSGLEQQYFELHFNRNFVKFLSSYVSDSRSLQEMLREYSLCFRSSIKEDNTFTNDSWLLKLQFLEFVIRDSIYCLTRILEIITPYTDTTLFTNTFLAEINLNLFKWVKLFEALFLVYKVSDLTANKKDNSGLGIDNDYEEFLKRYDRFYYRQENEYGCHYDEFDSDACPYKEAKSYEELSDDTCKMRINKCPFYEKSCIHKRTLIEYMKGLLAKEKPLFNILREYGKHDNQIAHEFFSVVLDNIGRTNMHYTLSNYSIEMALKMYRRVMETHHEGNAYKSKISGMTYLDDDLKNDTIQFDSALERMKINNGYIQKRMNSLLESFKITSLYDIENFCVDNETALTLQGRFEN